VKSWRSSGLLLRATFMANMHLFSAEKVSEDLRSSALMT